MGLPQTECFSVMDDRTDEPVRNHAAKKSENLKCEISDLVVSTAELLQ